MGIRITRPKRASSKNEESMKQSALFEADDVEAISINDVALSLNVSPASVRNWIKTGYLHKATKNSVTVESFLTFKGEILGAQKLNQRANKSLKDQHDHSGLEEMIQKKIRSNEVHPKGLSDIYEESLSESYKNKEGVFYTPQEIVQEFFEYLPEDCSELTFCDPCCGTGNFLVEAVKRGFKPCNIYGYDVDEVALEISRRRLNQFNGGDEANIEKRDFLAISCQVEQKYDVIFTNPPWGKKLPKKEKDLLADYLAAGNSKDTSAIFFFASMKILKPSGYLGFLLQDAFFNIASYENARKAALANRIIALIDFGKPFQGLLTKAKGIVLRKQSPDTLNTVICVSGKSKDKVPQKVFEKNPKSIFNFTCSETDREVIDHVLSVPHCTLRDSARWGLGIVTGNNKRFCLPEARDGYIPVFKGADITKKGLKKPSTYIPNDLAQYQQVAPVQLYNAEEKLIYKFISSELVFFYDTEKRFILNSANMLILEDSFPINHGELCALLNSRFMSWLFQKIFDTHKVLRADMESMPIFTDYFAERKNFSEESFLEYLSLEEVSGGTYRIKK
jgi:site-specific DNA-methyltransferase (adenine-specific)